MILAAELTSFITMPLLAAVGGVHSDPVAPVVLALAIVLIVAKLGGDLAVRMGQPAVLGELVCGIVLGNISVLGYSGLEYLKSDPAVDMLARIGVLILLFEVGLESTVRQMMKVGLSAFAVAALGVVTPFTLGWAVGALVLPHSSIYVHAFLGATLCATSVGITARVLKDLRRSQTSEAKVILGAAVIDDVLGLVILAVVTGVIQAAGSGESVSLGEISLMVGKAAIFLVGSLGLGVLVTPRLYAGIQTARARRASRDWPVIVFFAFLAGQRNRAGADCRRFRGGPYFGRFA